MSETLNARARDRQEAVFAAADEMVQEGLKPTVPAIVERIGGSNTTATKYLRQWRAQRKSNLPESQQMLQRVYEQMSANVQAEIDASEQRAERAEAERDAAKAAEEEALRGQKQANTQANIAVKEADKKFEAAKELAQSAAAREAGAAASQKALDEATEKAAQAEQQAIERAEALAGEIGKLADSREAFERTGEKLLKGFAALTQEIHALSERQAGIERQLTGLAQQGEAVKGRLESMDSTLDDHRQTIHTGLQDLATSQSQHAQQVRAAAEAATERAVREGRDALQSVSRDIKTQREELGRQVGELGDRIRDGVQRLEIYLAEYSTEAKSAIEAREKDERAKKE